MKAAWKDPTFAGRDETLTSAISPGHEQLDLAGQHTDDHVPVQHIQAMVAVIDPDQR
jgi:hypothetical protein